MSLLEQQNTLAKLYTDPEFRRSFFSDPESVGKDCGLDQREIEGLLGIDQKELEDFSESLVWKRLREVEKILPLTRSIIGGDFSNAFFSFAKGFTPLSQKKHYEDAMAFCRFVEACRVHTRAKDAARFERTRLEFNMENRRVALCRLMTSPPFAHANSPGDGVSMRRRFAVWVRFRKRVFHFVL